MIILCTHHKGGVGKTELAIHTAGILRQAEIERTLLVDCDNQADAWRFHTGQDPQAEGKSWQVDERMSVLWQPNIKKSVNRDELEGFDHLVIDVDAALQDTVQNVVQNHPDLVLIPVDDQQDALTNLKNPLGVIVSLEQTTKICPRVRIVPLGGAKVTAIRQALDSLTTKPQDCEIAAKIRNIKETNRRAERRYIWDYPGFEDLQGYFRDLINS